MPNLPIRGLGTVGVVTDIDPYNLPIAAFTRAKNVRFTEGKVTHGPVYRSIGPELAFRPVFAHGLFALSGYDTVLLVDDSFTVREFAGGSVQSETRYEGDRTSASARITATSLADVQYLNRSDLTPIVRKPVDANFSILPNWPDGATGSAGDYTFDNKWTASVLRSYGDFMLALCTTENGVEYPNRVRFGDPARANEVPSTWNEADTQSRAGFTDLVQMNTAIIDGATLGPNFLIYSQDQVWMMEYVGGTFIFNFRKLFSDIGVINHNCVVEVEGRHYVFDRDDIYVTDGVSHHSICKGKVRDYIFSGIDLGQDDKCFVMHNPVLEEIYFCYHSGDDMAEFVDGNACNRAAVYRYGDDTWTFQDLPNVVAGTIANVAPSLSYADVAASYADMGGSYHSVDSGLQRHPLMLSYRYAPGDATGSESRLLGVDLANDGALPQPVNHKLSRAAFLERIGIDMDEQGIPLSGHKVVNRLLPQISTTGEDGAFKFRFGAAMTPNQTPSYGPDVSFNALTDYKVDTRMAGRYLSYRLSTDSLKDFAFSGMDVDVVVTGRR